MTGECSGGAIAAGTYDDATGSGTVDTSIVGVGGVVVCAAGESECDASGGGSSVVIHVAGRSPKWRSCVRIDVVAAVAARHHTPVVRGRCCAHTGAEAAHGDEESRGENSENPRRARHRSTT